ncbi:MAG TPA: ATP-binding protein [Thermoplasmata archaeon]|nr:ATP-binding protein [Thermoplasmata archaeon]
MRVLLLEDSPSDEALTRHALDRTEGPPIELLTVRSVKDAVRELSSGKFDAVLADLNVTDSSGAATILSLVGRDRPPIIAFTGSIDENSGIDAVRAGAVDFFPKGSSGRDRLRRTIEYAVEGQRRHGFQVVEARLATLLVERTRALRNSQDQFHLTSDSVSEVIFLQDLETRRIVFINAAYQRVFGRDPLVLMRNPMDWLGSVHPEDLAQVEDLVLRHPERMPNWLRYRLISTDGNIHWMQVHFTERTGPEGDTRYRIGVVQDITELVEMETARTAASAREREIEAEHRVSEFRGRFLGAAAHELATPLTSLRLQLSSLDRLTRDFAEPRVHAAIESITRTASRLGGVIQDLMEASRIETHSVRFEWADADLVALASGVVETIRPIAIAGGVELSIDAPPELRARMDRGRIGQVLLNLLSNAIKFSPNGSSVTLRIAQVGRDCEIEVSDHGRGISADDLPKMFQPFGRVGEVGATKGTGLGLYISKRFVEAHGGTINVHSLGLGLGATIVVRLPIRGPPGTSSDDGAADIPELSREPAGRASASGTSDA